VRDALPGGRNYDGASLVSDLLEVRMTTTPAAQKSRLDPEPVRAATCSPNRLVVGGGGAAVWRSRDAAPAQGGGAGLSFEKVPRGAAGNAGAGEAFMPPGRPVAVFRDAEGVYAISGICTHLGCIVKASPEASSVLPWFAVRRGRTSRKVLRRAAALAQSGCRGRPVAGR